MTTHSPYNSQGWRARQQKATQRAAHQEKMAELRAERHRMFEAQTGGTPDPVAPAAPVQEVPVEAAETVPVPVTEPAPTAPAVEAPVAAETDADVEADTPAAPTKGRKKG